MRLTHEEFREKLRKSAEEAHRELFEQYCNYVYTIVFNRLRSCAGREDVEECVCDVFSDVYFKKETGISLLEKNGFLIAMKRKIKN